MSPETKRLAKIKKQSKRTALLHSLHRLKKTVKVKYIEMFSYRIYSSEATFFFAVEVKIVLGLYFTYLKRINLNPLKKIIVFQLRITAIKM